jgi:hypothetical protein
VPPFCSPNGVKFPLAAAMHIGSIWVPAACVAGAADHVGFAGNTSRTGWAVRRPPLGRSVGAGLRGLSIRITARVVGSRHRSPVGIHPAAGLAAWVWLRRCLTDVRMRFPAPRAAEGPPPPRQPRPHTGRSARRPPADPARHCRLVPAHSARGARRPAVRGRPHQAAAEEPLGAEPDTATPWTRTTTAVP